MSQTLSAGSVLRTHKVVSISEIVAEKGKGNQRVLIIRSPVGFLGDFSCRVTREYIVEIGRVARLVRVEISSNGERDIFEVGFFDKDLGAHARVDA